MLYSTFGLFIHFLFIRIQFGNHGVPRGLVVHHGVHLFFFLPSLFTCSSFFHYYGILL